MATSGSDDVTRTKLRSKLVEAERERCAKVAVKTWHFYVGLAERAVIAGDEKHALLCRSRAWAAEDIAREIRSGK